VRNPPTTDSSDKSAGANPAGRDGARRLRRAEHTDSERLELSSGPVGQSGGEDEQHSEPMALLTRRRLIVGIVLIVLSVGGLYFLIPKLAGLNHTWGELRRGDPVLLAVAAVSETVSIAGYALLFRTVFGRGAPRINLRTSVEIPLAGIAAIRLLATAGAGGIAVTAWALSRGGMSSRLIACRMVASLTVQYAVYLGALIVLGIGLFTGVIPGGGSFALTILPAILSAGLAALLLSMVLVPSDFERRLAPFARRKGRIGRLAGMLGKAPVTLGSGVRTAIQLVREGHIGLVGVLAYWVFDIAALALSFRAFGAEPPVAVVAMGYFLGTLGSLLPIPGGIGGVEGGMIGAFVAFGVHADHAVVAVLAYRAISFWLPTLPGIAGYVSLRRTVHRWQAEDEPHPTDADPVGQPA
jgi:uncharacterized protein (TIRG00374 family)